LSLTLPLTLSPLPRLELSGDADFYGYIYGMARPRKDPSERKTVDVRIPLTESQKKLVSTAAGADKADVAAWLRPIVLRAAEHRLSKREKRPR
jgi:hypothetical protein